ncbi:MAG: DUF1624 domain-containing protein [Gemmatimonadaceae bacterium]
MTATVAVDRPEPAGTATDAAPPAASASRLTSIDIIRGAVMVLMAIDHVRVFAAVPAGGPTPGLFFTRWITHFCAPAFVFFAGTAAFLHGRRLHDQGALSKWLLIRGAWLVLLELTVIRLSWTFNVDYGNYMLAGVIWMLGICMMLMAGLVRLPIKAAATMGVAIIALHNVTDVLPSSVIPRGESAPWLWQLLYLGGVVQIGGDGGPPLAVLYVIIPWIGVMAAGYGFGQVLVLAPERRRRLCMMIGLGATLLFLVGRGMDRYGDPRRWSPPPPAPRTAPATPPRDQAAQPAPPPAPPRPPAYVRFLNTTKYPASLLFLLMTLGPAIALIPLLERSRGRVVRWLTIFGRVPMFYYLLHIPLIHLVFVGLSLARYGTVIPWLTDNHPMFVGEAPDGYMYSLPALYAVTALVVTILYFPCRWYARLKAERRESWLTFL